MNQAFAAPQGAMMMQEDRDAGLMDPQPMMDGQAVLDLQTQRYHRLLLDQLATMWTSVIPAEGETYSAFAHRLYGQQPGRIDGKQFECRHMEILQNAIDLYRLLMSQHLVGDFDRDTLETDKRVRRVLEAIQHAYYHVDSAMRGEAIATENNEMYVPPQVSLFRVSTIDVQNNEPHQNLLLFLLGEAFHKGYRRYKGSVYEQIYTDSEQGHLPTHAWREVSTVEEFVYNSVQKEVNYQQWLNLTHRSNTAKSMIEYLSKSKADSEFPFLTPDRTVTAWRNGLYMADQRRFIPYDVVQQEVDTNVVACKYYDYEFYDAPTPEGRDGWYQLPTPVFESIMSFQDLPKEAKMMMYVMIGRMRYPLGQYDRWQVVPFIKGMAGTGKSTIGKYILEMFEFADIGVMSSNIEEKFGLAGIMDKFAWICLEVKRNFALAQSEFQSMISGEHMSIPVKNQTAKTTLWSSPGFLCGNEMAKWVDAAGSMSRRLYIWEFYNIVRDADPTLEPRLKAELGVFIRKVNEAYREFTDRYGGNDIWTIAESAYFSKTRERAKAVINPIISFIQTSEMVRINKEGGYMKLLRFKELYISWAKNLGRALQFDEEQWVPVFSEYHLTWKVEERLVRNQRETACFISGIEEIVRNDRG